MVLTLYKNVFKCCFVNNLKINFTQLRLSDTFILLSEHKKIYIFVCFHTSFFNSFKRITTKEQYGAN